MNQPPRLTNHNWPVLKPAQPKKRCLIDQPLRQRTIIVPPRKVEVKDN